MTPLPRGDNKEDKGDNYKIGKIRCKKSSSPELFSQFQPNLAESILG